MVKINKYNNFHNKSHKNLNNKQFIPKKNIQKSHFSNKTKKSINKQATYIKMLKNKACLINNIKEQNYKYLNSNTFLKLKIKIIKNRNIWNTIVFITLKNVIPGISILWLLKKIIESNYSIEDIIQLINREIIKFLLTLFEVFDLLIDNLEMDQYLKKKLTNIFTMNNSDEKIKKPLTLGSAEENKFDSSDSESDFDAETIDPSILEGQPNIDDAFDKELQIAIQRSLEEQAKQKKNKYFF